MQKHIPLEELTFRSLKLNSLLPDNSVFILFSGSILARNGDTDYNFRQESSFWYLTGIDEPESALVLVKKNGKLDSTLYITQKTLEQASWTGKRLDLDTAIDISGVNKVSYFSEFFPMLELEMKSVHKVFFDFQSVFTPKLIDLVNKSKLTPELGSVKNLLQQLRVKKSAWEIEQLRISSQINTIAFNKVEGILDDWFKTKSDLVAEPFLKPLDKAGLFEYQIEAEILNIYKQNGLEWSYPPIVAGGKNATTLHYTKNNSLLGSGDLLLIDAGCEYNYYASDITRTFMLGDGINTFQKEIYELVLKANLAVIEAAKKALTLSDLGIIEKITLQDLHKVSVQTLVQGLVDLNILMEGYEAAIEKQSYKKILMHSTSHWLGLDVHDLGAYSNTDGQETILEPGMVFTVEPGLYFDNEDESIPPELRGIGVRIEDDLVVTEEGIVVLSEGVNK